MLPSFEDCKEIVSKNDAFSHSIVTRGNFDIHTFGYRLASYSDFYSPINGSKIEAHELRGLTFVIDKNTGQIKRHLLLHKFFGIDQTTGYMIKDIKDIPIIQVTEKLDGSLIRFIKIGDEIIARSKSSVDGIHCIRANEILSSNNDLKMFVQETLDNDIVAVFELISPEYKIVIDYPKDELRLLQIRSEETGEYCRDINNHYLVKKYNIKTAVIDDIHSFEDIFKYQSKEKNEGLVIHLDNDQFVKIKTVYYDHAYDYHKKGDNSVRNLISMIIHEVIDDVYPSLSDDDKKIVDNISSIVNSFVNKTARIIDNEIENYNGNRKELVEKYKGTLILGILMKSLTDRNTMDNIKMFIKSETKTQSKAEAFIKKIMSY